MNTPDAQLAAHVAQRDTDPVEPALDDTPPRRLISNDDEILVPPELAHIYNTAALEPASGRALAAEQHRDRAAGCADPTLSAYARQVNAHLAAYGAEAKRQHARETSVGRRRAHPDTGAAPAPAERRGPPLIQDGQRLGRELTTLARLLHEGDWTLLRLQSQHLAAVALESGAALRELGAD